MVRSGRWGVLLWEVLVRAAVLRTQMYWKASGRIAGAIVLLGALGCAGCASVRVTDPARTADEEFLIAQAASQAVAKLSAANLRDRKVYVDSSYLIGPAGRHSDAATNFDMADARYLVAEVRAKLLLGGVRLMDDRKDADIIVELRSAALSVNKSNLLVGLPAIQVPGALTGGTSALVATPEIAIVKNVKQRGYASVAFVAYWKDTGEAIASSGPFIGRTWRDDWWFFGIGPRTSGDIPPAKSSP